MRAAVLHGKEDVRIEEVEPRPLEQGEVRVRIDTALTCGTDLKVYKRGYHARMIVPPAVFGHELAGTIEEVHPSVSGWEAGDRVVAANSAPCGACFYCGNRQENLCDDLLFLNGAYAESIVIPARIVARNLLRLDDRTRFVDAALTEPFACVVQGVNDLALRGGERVLVMGSGPIGLLFVALCQHLGCDVTLIGRGENRLAAASRLGAKTLVASDTLKPEGRTFDVVIEAVGKPETWEEATRWVRKGIDQKKQREERAAFDVEQRLFIKRAEWRVLQRQDQPRQSRAAQRQRLLRAPPLERHRSARNRRIRPPPGKSCRTRTARR